MIFTFYYYLSDNGLLIPNIKLVNEHNAEVNLVIFYLTDDGGGSVSSHIRFLKNNLNALKTKNYQTDISSNSYGVDYLDDDFLSIYFLYDENTKLKIKKDSLMNLLEKWILFLEMKPTKDYLESLNIEII